MTDLMKGTYNYKKLVNQYGNFIVPAIKIKVNGTDVIKNMKLEIYEMKVTLTLNSASIVVIKIADVYKEANHSFDSKIKDKFKLGTIVEVEMGYLSATSMIFKGFIAMIGAEFESIPLLVVTLMDARRLMMLSGKKQIYHIVKNYSEGFKAVIDDYSKLCTAEIDATDDKLENPLSQMTNDYDFITKELIKRGKVEREFFILGSKAYFRKPRKVTAPIMKVKYGQELYSLKIDAGYLDLTVEVLGYNPTEQKQVKGSATAKSSEPMTEAISQKSILMITDADADSQEKAKIRATALASKEAYRMRTGRGTTIGLPEIVPGRYLEVEALEPMLNKKYYISEVVHTYDTKHFMTSFEIEGWE